VSWSQGQTAIEIDDSWQEAMPRFHFAAESEENFASQIKQGVYTRVRFLSEPSEAFFTAAAASSTYLDQAPVLANGRFELLHYLREISLSHDYHRYGNLGLREGELRKEIL
jgi:RHH-type proline utilization regulon transcriptional repressor/proline dehydrogenase/delta 1-pyrroline-5-carboxylate dehydrogenase